MQLGRGAWNEQSEEHLVPVLVQLGEAAWVTASWALAVVQVSGCQTNWTPSRRVLLGCIEVSR